MEIKRNGSQPAAKGPADWFTGAVRIDSPFRGTDEAREGFAAFLGKRPAHWTP